MTRCEKYEAEAAKLNKAGFAKLDEADKLGMGDDVSPEDQERSDALYKEAEDLHERAGAFRKRALEAKARDADERLADAERQRNKWRERSQASDGVRTSDLNDMPTVAQLVERNREVKLRLRGAEYDEDLAARAWPAESLYVPMLRRELLGAAKAPVSDEQVQAWEEYVGVAALAERALTPTANTTVAGKGLELVPENMANRIYAKMQLIGGFADMTGLSTFTQNNPGAFKVPTEANITDVEDTATTKFQPKRTAQAADTALSEPDTGEKSIDLHRFDVATVLTDEQLMSGNVSLEAFLIAQIGRQFGAKLNRQVTRGTGTQEATGITSLAAQKETVGTTKVISETDVEKLFAKINGYYVSLPDSVVHAHYSTIIKMYTARETTGGNLVFDRTPDGLGVTAFGKRVMPNNALTPSTEAGSNPIMLIGLPEAYVVVTDGPLRFERERTARSAQWTLYWRQMLGGAPAVNEAFAWLEGA